jgi:hypothetical protein
MPAYRGQKHLELRVRKGRTRIKEFEMKKAIVLGTILVMVSLSVHAQGIYADLGFGVGKAWTKIEGNDVRDALVDSRDFAMNFGGKAGYGPFSDIPLYFVLEWEGTGHMLWNTDKTVQFNSYLLGPGAVFYPIPLIQLGLSLGYSWTNNNEKFDRDGFYNSNAGFAWNTSAALDLGGKWLACLVGIKYSMAIHPDETQQMFGAFLKLAFRKKAPSFF